MDDAKQQLIDRLQKANNILVTVSHDPSVDQLASCIALTLLLNKQGKHAAAVFSGKVPSTLEFLNPGETLEKNTDSLRDFIISLDKSKADKLRYKVEENVVRIFITPYKTSLSADDLEFSEGDFNVDVVVALGVKQQEDLDEAITAHGRILHDATVSSINASADGGLGSINWHDQQASSLSELVTDLAQALGSNLLDEQIATALLTGIVSETGRFANDRTSSQTMSASAALLSAGANQQLVATKLEEKPAPPPANDAVNAKAADNNEEQHAEGDENGVLEIDHLPGEQKDDVQAKGGQPSADSDNPSPGEVPAPAPEPSPPVPPEPQAPDNPEPPASSLSAGAKLVTEPPSLGGTLTANSQAEGLDPVTDPMSMPQAEPPEIRSRSRVTPPSKPLMPAPSDWKPPVDITPAPQPTAAHPQLSDPDHATLTDIEKSVDSPHLTNAELKDVRSEVDKALSGSDVNKPIEALNAQPLGDELHPPGQPAPGQVTSPSDGAPAAPDTKDGNAPPPVPPPIPFQFGNSPPSQ